MAISIKEYIPEYVEDYIIFWNKAENICPGGYIPSGAYSKEEYFHNDTHRMLFCRFVAFDDDLMIGSVDFFFIDENILSAHYFHVLPDYQRQHVGVELLYHSFQKILDYNKEGGAIWYFKTDSWESNFAARNILTQIFKGIESTVGEYVLVWPAISAFEGGRRFIDKHNLWGIKDQINSLTLDCYDEDVYQYTMKKQEESLSMEIDLFQSPKHLALKNSVLKQEIILEGSKQKTEIKNHPNENIVCGNLEVKFCAEDRKYVLFFKKKPMVVQYYDQLGDKFLDFSEANSNLEIEIEIDCEKIINRITVSIYYKNINIYITKEYLFDPIDNTFKVMSYIHGKHPFPLSISRGTYCLLKQPKIVINHKTGIFAQDVFFNQFPGDRYFDLSPDPCDYSRIWTGFVEGDVLVRYSCESDFAERIKYGQTSMPSVYFKMQEVPSIKKLFSTELFHIRDNFNPNYLCTYFNYHSIDKQLPIFNGTTGYRFVNLDNDCCFNNRLKFEIWSIRKKKELCEVNIRIAGVSYSECIWIENREKRVICIDTSSLHSGIHCAIIEIKNSIGITKDQIVLAKPYPIINQSKSQISYSVENDKSGGLSSLFVNGTNVLSVAKQRHNILNYVTPLSWSLLKNRLSDHPHNNIGSGLYEQENFYENSKCTKKSLPVKQESVMENNFSILKYYSISSLNLFASIFETKDTVGFKSAVFSTFLNKDYVDYLVIVGDDGNDVILPKSNFSYFKYFKEVVKIKNPNSTSLDHIYFQGDCSEVFVSFYPEEGFQVIMYLNNINIKKPTKAGVMFLFDIPNDIKKVQKDLINNLLFNVTMSNFKE
ncbi:MAG: GNAT family N-acetyltransferase [Oligoflexia bacterium]|nr:GNAT family N-acetyltransferase [Oligoflexia bacterium]